MMAAPPTIYLTDELRMLVEKVSQATEQSDDFILLNWLTNPISVPTREIIQNIVKEMDAYNRIQLWTLVYRDLPSEIEARHQTIVQKNEAGKELTAQEEKDWDNSVKLGEIYMLLRSKALAILKERGENIDIFLNRELD